MKRLRLLSMVAVAALTAGPRIQAQQPVFTADTFLDHMAINCNPFSMTIQDGPWKGAGAHIAPDEFFAMGFRHYRIALKDEMTDPKQPAMTKDAWDRYGAQPMMLLSGQKNGTPANVVEIAKQYAPGVIGLIEGPNEVNNKFPPQVLNLHYKNKVDEAAGAAYMDDVYAALKGDPATRNIGVVAYTAIFTDYRDARPHRAFDFANMHSYQGWGVPEDSIEANMKQSNHILGDGGLTKPYVPTECGYNVPEQDPAIHAAQCRAQARAIPVLFGEYFRWGIRRSYLFAVQNADAYGLTEDKFAKRPSFFACKNLIALLHDADWDPKTHTWPGAEFTPRMLNFKLEGAPATVHSVTLQKRSGEWIVLLWNEQRFWDEGAHKEILTPEAPVTLRFSTPVRPSASLLTQTEAGDNWSPTPVAVQGGALKLNVTSTLMMLRLTPAQASRALPLEPPAAVTGAATNNSVALTWAPPVTGAARVAGYFVYRNDKLLTTTTDLTYDDRDSILTPGIGFTYAVQAFDKAGNMSARMQRVVFMEARYPDLALVSIQTDPAAPKPGDAVTFTATVQNRGDGPTPSNTAIMASISSSDHTFAWGGVPGPLAPGQTAVLRTTAGPQPLWTAREGYTHIQCILDDINRMPFESSKLNNRGDKVILIGQGGAGLLVGRGDPQPGSFNLTREGTEDWIHWGLKDKTTVVRKAGGPASLSAVTEVGTQGYMDSQPGCSIAATWSDGDAAMPKMADTHTCLWLNIVGHGFQFTAPADTQIRVLKVWIAGLNGTGKLTAHLSDASAPDYVSTVFSSNQDGNAVQAGPYSGVYTLRYHAGSAGQKMVITWGVDSENNQFAAQAQLQAAALSVVK